MSNPTVSVIVVSRGRAADLPLCLIGISQLDYPEFEVVLVADKDGMNAARDLHFFDDLKCVPFEEANISTARNLGIAEAAGEIAAFIDDDAVPEPSWLTYLVAGFTQQAVQASGGFVIGRNGISFQWKARSVDCIGVASALDVDETQISILGPHQERAVKTEGTNMAFRRETLAHIGGFDPAFRFYLDETDLNFRMSKLGYRTAIVPLAQVHHGYKASATRRGDRVPTDLFEIGASLAAYLRKHAPLDRHADALKQARCEQRTRALRHMVNGGIEPRDVRRLLSQFDKGVAAGQKRSLHTPTPIPFARTGFQKFPCRYSGDQRVLSGRYMQRKELIELANGAVKTGQRASVFIFSLTARPHKIRFVGKGVWLQIGGLFGQSERTGRRILVQARAQRLARELKRVAKLRKFPARRE